MQTEHTRMRAVIQRVSRAQVCAGGKVVGRIGAGLLVLLGMSKPDTQNDAEYLAAKITALRILEDEGGKMNVSVAESGGAVLVVPQFTLYGDVRKGRRPSFEQAAPPEQARRLYLHLVQKIRDAGVTCETGEFQATMRVELVNEGPVTILLDSERKF
jgi:D-tyrosyl-tRNA(Tyr) deacylase